MSGQAPLFKRVALIGVGLIGASLALCLRGQRLAGDIVGCARSAATRETALRLGLVDRVEADPGAAAEGADLVMICAPMSAYAAIGAAIAPRLKAGAVVSDVGSVKAPVLKTLAPLLPAGAALVPGHPVAGTERSGPEAGFAELFQGRWCILTPPDGAPAKAVDRLAEMWRRCGMRVERMDAARHDMVLAITSHLPHLIAYTIVGTATDLEDDLQAEVVKFAAGGFRDFTRIAASDPTMWRDIFLANREAVLEMLGRFDEDLTRLKRDVRRGDGDALFDWFTRTRAIRRSLVEARQD